MKIRHYLVVLGALLLAGCSQPTANTESRGRGRNHRGNQPYQMGNQPFQRRRSVGDRRYWPLAGRRRRLLLRRTLEVAARNDGEGGLGKRGGVHR